MASQNEFDREQLLAEELQPEEVRLLLERLGAREFGGSEHATVGAVVEASGADPVTVAGLLAQIRKEAFEEKYQAAFEDHEERIGTLEETIKPPRGALTQKEREDIVNVVREEREEEQTRKEKEQTRKFVSTFVTVIIASIAIFLFIFFLEAKQRLSPDERPIRTIHFGDGLVIEEVNGGALRVKRPDGSYRFATNEEAGRVSTFQIRTKG